MKQYHYTLKKVSVVFVTLLLIAGSLSAQSYDIYVFDINTGTTTKITNISNAGEFNVTWSGNGKKIAHDVVGAAAAPFDQTIFITDVRSGISAPLIGAEGGNDAAWSPGEEENEDDDISANGTIAFDDFHIYPYSIYTVPAKGGTRSLFRYNCHHASWNPKGNKIAFDDNNGYIGTRDIKTGNETFVTYYGDRPAWSPNGQYIAFDGWGWAGGGVWIVKVDTSGNPIEAPLQLTTSGYGPTWSNNSKTIYYIDWPTGDPDVWSIPATGGPATRVCGRIGGFDKGDFDPACSHNGKFIAFSSYTDTPAVNPTNKANTRTTTLHQSDFVLEQNFPNPFAGTTKIGFRLASPAHVLLSIYNASGQKIKTLANADFGPGSYSYNWNGKDEYEKTLPAGVYIYQMKAGNIIQSRKIIIGR